PQTRTRCSSSRSSGSLEGESLACSWTGTSPFQELTSHHRPTSYKLIPIRWMALAKLDSGAVLLQHECEYAYSQGPGEQKVCQVSVQNRIPSPTSLPPLTSAQLSF